MLDRRASSRRARRRGARRGCGPRRACTAARRAPKRVPPASARPRSSSRSASSSRPRSIRLWPRSLRDSASCQGSPASTASAQRVLEAHLEVGDAEVAERQAAHPAREQPQREVAGAVGELDGALRVLQRGRVGAGEEREVRHQRGQLGAGERVVAGRCARPPRPARTPRAGRRGAARRSPAGPARGPAPWGARGPPRGRRRRPRARGRAPPRTRVGRLEGGGDGHHSVIRAQVPGT